MVGFACPSDEPLKLDLAELVVVAVCTCRAPIELIKIVEDIDAVEELELTFVVAVDEGAAFGAVVGMAIGHKDQSFLS